ncbi:hypothetical protein JX265_013872 [Neoarthrinium moseri]|uniref:Uncharacterized protein n=1 Tax=Neoarthrinium moseri TaxID=1658444 RepID=A0A9P9W7M2_9PEZI|nr:hypothetical protein JX265_013872 [Neoarthrinium moseri]
MSSPDDHRRNVDEPAAAINDSAAVNGRNSAEDASQFSKLYDQIVEALGPSSRGPYKLHDLWIEARDARDSKTASIFANVNCIAWCVWTLVHRPAFGATHFSGQVQCQEFLRKVDEQSREYKGTLAKAIVSSISGNLKSNANLLRQKCNAAQKKRKRVHADEGDRLGMPDGTSPTILVDQDSQASDDGGDALERSPSITPIHEKNLHVTKERVPMGNEEPQIELDFEGRILSYKELAGTFSITRQKGKHLLGTLWDAMVRYAPLDGAGLYIPGVKMFVAGEGTRNWGYHLEIELDDERAPDYISKLFGQTLRIDGRGRYLLLHDGRVYRPGQSSVLERCKRSPDLEAAFSTPLYQGITFSPLYQAEDKKCISTTTCVWATVSSRVEVKVRLSVLLHKHAGLVIYNTVFNQSEPV